MQPSLFLPVLLAYLAAAQVQAPGEAGNPETVQGGDAVIYPTATLSTGIPATSVLPGVQGQSPSGPTGIASLNGPNGPSGPGGEPEAVLPPAPEPQPYPETPGPMEPIGPGPLVPTTPGPGPSLPTGMPETHPGEIYPEPVPTGPLGPPIGPPPPGVTGPGTGYPPLPPGATSTTGPVTGPPPSYVSGGNVVSAKLGSGAVVAFIMCMIAMM